jgi:hypothetical protein|uniref:Uncharacterized protein n=1 Tax=viral metagenome TaxID=1070528 RepID=A0A6C0ENW8_9ZZZZ
MTKTSDLEKRVAKLEKEIATLMKTHAEHDAKPQATAMDLARPSGKTQKHSKRVKKHTPEKTKKKRKINEYFKMMLDAKKAGKPSFVYKGHTYKGTKHPRLGMIYKKG